jgi:hypothetical protein
MSQEADSNNRKHTRVAVHVTAEIYMEAGAVLKGTTRNMSFGGAFININIDENATPSIGEKCELHLKLGSSEAPLTVPVKCKLARTNADGLGIEFLSTTIEGYWHFKNLMVYNSPESDRLLQELETHPGLSIKKENQS